MEKEVFILAEDNLFSENELYSILEEVKKQKKQGIQSIMLSYIEPMLKECNNFLVKANLYNAHAKKYTIQGLDSIADELLYQKYRDNKKFANRSALLRSAYEIINLFGEIFRQQEIEYKLLMYDAKNITEIKERVIPLKDFLKYTRGGGGFNLRTNQKLIDKNLKNEKETKSWDQNKVNRFIAFRSHIQLISQDPALKKHTRLNIQRWGNLNNGKYLEGFLHYEEESLTSRCLGMYYAMNITESWKGPDLSTTAQRYFQLKGQSADVFSSIERTVKDIQLIKQTLESLKNFTEKNIDQIAKLNDNDEIVNFINKNGGQELNKLFEYLEKEFNLTN